MRWKMIALTLFASALAPASSFADRAADLARLAAPRTFWESRLPYCEDFMSKEYSTTETVHDAHGREITRYKPCDDGDTILFAGLTCSVGDARGCEAVRRSQGPDGRWWRSPRKLRLQEAEGGSESTFSNDHAKGVWAYIAERRDRGAFERWTHWISKNDKTLGFIPQYCVDPKCAFKFIDCPLLDRLAVHLEIGNPICDAAPLPPLPILGQPRPSHLIEELQNGFKAVEDLVRAVPGGELLLKLDPLRKEFHRAVDKLQAEIKKLEALESRIKALARATTQSAEFVARVNRLVNDPGFARHNVATTAYLLIKYGGLNGPALYDAANALAADEPENAFHHYIIRGASGEMTTLILNKCRAQDDGQMHPRHQWIWERTDKDKSNPAADTMYWDCLFVAKLFEAGSLPGTTLPRIEPLEELYRVERQAFDAAKAEVERVLAVAKEMKPTPGDLKDILDAPTTIPGAAGGAVGAAIGGKLGGAIAGNEGKKAGGGIGEAAGNPVGTGKKIANKVGENLGIKKKKKKKRN